MATVFIPSLLRKFTDGQEAVVVSGRNVGEIIKNLDLKYPGLAAQLLEENDLKSSIAVAVDGEIGVGGVLEAVQESSEIHFVPAISGGLK